MDQNDQFGQVFYNLQVKNGVKCSSDYFCDMQHISNVMTSSKMSPTVNLYEHFTASKTLMETHTIATLRDTTQVIWTQFLLQRLGFEHHSVVNNYNIAIIFTKLIQERRPSPSHLKSGLTSVLTNKHNNTIIYNYVHKTF